METERPSASNLVEKSIDSAIRAWGTMKPLLLSAALACIAVGAAGYEARRLLGLAQAETTSVAALFVDLAQKLAYAAIAAPVAVAIHRMILMGETTRGFICLRPSYTRMFFLWAGALTLIGRAAYDAGSLGAGMWPARGAALAVSLLSLRLVLVFPAIAIASPADGWRNRLTTSWRQTERNFWLLLRALLLNVLPLIAFALPFWIIGYVPVYFLGASLPAAERTTLVPIIFVSAIQPVAVMLGAGIASWLYAWVRQQPAGLVPTAQPSAAF